MKSKKILLTSALTGALLLAACGNEEDVESSEETEVETETETEDVAESTDGNDEEEIEETKSDKLVNVEKYSILDKVEHAEVIDFVEVNHELNFPGETNIVVKSIELSKVEHNDDIRSEIITKRNLHDREAQSNAMNYFEENPTVGVLSLELIFEEPEEPNDEIRQILHDFKKSAIMINEDSPISSAPGIFIEFPPEYTTEYTTIYMTHYFDAQLLDDLTELDIAYPNEILSGELLYENNEEAPETETIQFK